MNSRWPAFALALLCVAGVCRVGARVASPALALPRPSGPELTPRAAPTPVGAGGFFPDDPIVRVPESQDAAKVREVDRSLLYDILVNSFARPGDPAIPRAGNVNTVDEVPDSGWFTNRIRVSGDGNGDAGLTPEDVARGPAVGDGPADGPWTIVRSKSEGLTPGFTVRDARGVVWFLKFDPPGSPELASGAEVVSTRLFHAAGYFVPDNRIAAFRRDRLVVGDGATIKIGGGAPRQMVDADIDRLLRRTARSADGTYRVLASRAVDGRPVGSFSYYGRRSDDPNDVVPHEHRRELRALRVLAAWTQHVDTKAGNSLDTVIAEGGRSRVRHYLIDLGSTLGSAGIKPRDYNEGHEALVEPDLIWRGVLGLGFFVRSWRTIPYQEWPSIGRFEGERFEPDAWVPSIPNAAFLRARPDDLFWGARRVMAFSDAAIRATVHEGAYSDAAAERHLADALIARRNRIGRAWLPIVNPVVDPTLDDRGRLRFVNAAVAASVAPAPKGGYQAVWYAFDNATGESTKLGDTSGESELAAPRRLPDQDGAYVRVDLSAIDPPPPHRAWTTPATLHFRRDAPGWKLVGLRREPPPF